MSAFTIPRFSLFILLIISVAFAVFVTVHAEFNPIKLSFSDDRFVVDDRGICSGTMLKSSCPVSCFRPDPVCGINGVTYWCGCTDALCAGTQVVKVGFCQVGDGGNSTVSGQALLLVHIVWLIVLGIFVLFGLL